MLINFIRKKNYLIEIVLDVFIFAFSYIAAFYVRLEGEMTAKTLSVIRTTLPIVVVTRTVVFFTLRVFSGQWRYCSIIDVISIMRAIIIGTLFIAFFIFVYTGFTHFPRAVLIIDWMIVTLLIGGVRFSKRLIKELFINATHHTKRILIVGAGRVGKTLINEMRTNYELGFKPVALVDDDDSKLDQVYYGVKVYGTRMSITHLVATMNIEEIIIALPHLSGEELREIVNLCRLSKKPYKMVSDHSGPTDQQDIIGRIRNINIADLIGRRPIQIDFDRIREFIDGKRVLVTGAAGSIGSELCRQIAQFCPEKLIAFDRSENGLFYLDRELDEKFQNLDYSLALADITDFDEANRIFCQYKPHLVFHAAAYKHVPMMEMNPLQAIKNNIQGTKTIVDIAIDHNASKFIFISTDKAVNPSNIMGLTKRIAEQYIQSCDKQGLTQCVAVRFGNVIGSSGSVIRLFEEQISKGGPLTVTHPDVARYFMTIQEAVQLVLQAANLGNGGEIFVLKMGELVKIYDLAKELILLSNLVPNKDIKIQFVGLRPGEKIIEELWESNEKCTEDCGENLYIIRNGNHHEIEKYRQRVNKIISFETESHQNLDGLRSELTSMIYSNN